jgi:hypothetical protein
MPPVDPAIVYDYDPRDLPAEYLQAIGLVTAAAAQTEHIEQMFIAACLGIDGEYGAAVTTHMTAPLRDNVARAAAELRINDVDALDLLDNLLDEVQAAAGKRNDVVHHGWCRDPNSGAVFTQKNTARGSVRVDLIPMSIDQIKGDATFVYEAGMKLLNFMTRYKLWPDVAPLRPRGHKTKAARKARAKKGG